MSNPPDLMTAAQAARTLCVSMRSLGRMIDADQIKVAYKVPGTTGARLFAPAEVERVKALREKAAA